LAVFTRDEKEIYEIVKLLNLSLDIKDLGPIQKLLGVNFENYDGKIVLHQRPYIDSLENQYDMNLDKIVEIPLPVDYHLINLV